MRPRLKSPLRYLIVGLVALLVISSMTAIAATNTVPSTRLASQTIAFNINHLKPSACAGITVTSLITGSGAFDGSGGADLLLGSPAPDTIRGLGGRDCILGGGGDDTLNGGGGDDVCIGGPGTDTFTSCEVAIQ